MEYKQITLTEIYIPICFYFNLVPLSYCNPPFQFTFQYVSILIEFTNSNIVTVAAFTFQYVSILIGISDIY